MLFFVNLFNFNVASFLLDKTTLLTNATLLLENNFSFIFFEFDSFSYLSPLVFIFIGFFLLFFGFLACFIENPVFAVIFLILSFIFASFFFFILNFFFMGLLIIIVYVGAISVLFLYSVMLYRIRNFDLFRKGYLFLIFSSVKRLFIFFFFLFIIFFFFFSFDYQIFYCELSFSQFLIEFFTLKFPEIIFNFNMSDRFVLSEPEFLGYFLYNDLFIYIILVSYILLVAMISVILFTRLLNKKETNFLFRFYSQSKLADIQVKDNYYGSTINLYNVK